LLNSPPHLKGAATLLYDLSLITIHVLDDRYFRQCSTLLRYGGIFKHSFTANLLVNLSVQEFWKSDSIWRCYT